MAKKTLGRGFDSLIPTNFVLGDVVSPGEQIKQIPIIELIANPDQPRKSFDEDALQELADSIKQHGIIQPLVATPYRGKYRIVAGERRFRASQIAGLTKVPVVISNHEELEELEIALVENVQRVDLSPLEQAVSIVRLHDQFSMSFRDIAKKLGKAETTISNIVRLLQLPDAAIEALRKNEITEGHARTILSFKTDEKQQLELLNKIITQGLSVRQAEAYVQNTKNKKPQVTINSSFGPETKKRIEALKIIFNNKLIVKEKSANSGSIILKYSSGEELESYIAKLQD